MFFTVERKIGVWIIAACVISVIVVILLIVPVILMSKKSTTPHEKGYNSFGASPSFAIVTGFNFRYDVLERATSYFDPANKLGLSEGDGSVFKGTLPSGRIVAVKRLFFDTRQWTDVLFNEVNLINGIQHKNVVKLLGCSIDGLESLLVYEFLPGKSLDQILFDKDSENALPWEKRFQIICGIAEGLAYLHEGSGTKIIHRDIKSSSILLDEALNPKIVDFGFSLGSAENKYHLNTRIAYVAPECLNKGELTEKADVYAFGVMLTEIVCGKKNCVFPQGSNSILHCVWKNYKANNITTSVDPALQGKIVAEEASNALQVSLLCTQSSPPLRPSMSEVVQMLTKKEYNIPIPIQQPFINYTRLTLDNRTASTVSNMSNGRASSRSSFHSTTSSLHQGEETTLLESSFSSSAKFNTSRSPDSDIQVNIVVAQPR
ncbi:cysteine-rich receptor-like protein kinase 1 [Lathyrus oleraceus]|uniref:cysteine-rich receptor-like protein kinase 1 n=1 Tax=Pisum sativum TaxID=3888 RepID=UPI0021CF2568|nr:cysteine-rich receptor-like protein kinase 1 [Pisum sativum]